MPNRVERGADVTPDTGAVEAVLSGAQYRETGASGLCGVKAAETEFSGGECVGC